MKRHAAGIGPIYGDILHYLGDASLAARYQFCAYLPSLVMLRPASLTCMARTASASRRLLWVQPAHLPAAQRAAALPTESYTGQWPGPEAWKAQPGQSDSDGLCWPGPVP